MSDATASQERDLPRRRTAEGHTLDPGDIAIGVIISRTSEFFHFFVFAIASVLVFPARVFPFASPEVATLYAFAIFSLAFLARPFGTWAFMTLDRIYGKTTKLTIALFMLGTATVGVAFLPTYETIGAASIWILALLRIGQGFALGGSWDGLPSLLAMSAPGRRRGWWAMIPQLGAPIAFILAGGLFAFFYGILPAEDFLDWGWRFPFFVAFAVNVVGLFARLRIVATQEYAHQFERQELQASRVRLTLRSFPRLIAIGAFTPLASFALFHMVTLFPLSWIYLYTEESVTRFLMIAMAGACVGIVAIGASGVLSDRYGRRRLLSVIASCIAVFSILAPSLLDGGEIGEFLYVVMGYTLLGLSFGQSSGSIAANFPRAYRYTGSAVVSDLAWMIGAGLAPFTALFLAGAFGLWAAGLYLLSGAVCTLLALRVNTMLDVERN